jgi:YHS domain-containing protein
MLFRRLAGLVLLFQVLSLSGGLAFAGPQFAVALQGYDTVSYFEDGAAAKGKDGAPAKGKFEHAVFWNGATWLFANDAHARRFKANPTQYAPQFDGYCALAASLGYKAPAEALTGKVVDGKLYLNYNTDVRKQWSTDIPGFVAKADKNWPQVSRQTKVIE